MLIAKRVEKVGGTLSRSIHLHTGSNRKAMNNPTTIGMRMLLAKIKNATVAMDSNATHVTFTSFSELMVVICSQI